MYKKARKWIVVLGISFVFLSGLTGLLQADTIALWHFDEESGSIAKDSVGTHDLRIVKGIEGTNFKWVKTDSGNALWFDGRESYSSVTNWDLSNLTKGTIEFSFKLDRRYTAGKPEDSLGLWAYYTDINNVMRLIFNGHTGTLNYQGRVDGSRWKNYLVSKTKK
ncbi:hypothetical protein J7K43_03895 [Candidatus Calescamantes bacterium]|nr:hypothetical protein [Candidatus Calescamantes bacterium]